MLATLPVCLAALPPASANEPDRQTLSVMTWNLEWFYDDEDRDNYSRLSREKSTPSRALWNWRRDAVARRIAKLRPTIVAFQEVENRRVLWYLTRAIDRNHSLDYEELAFESRDHFTGQDVGMLYRDPAEVLMTSQFHLSNRDRDGQSLSDVAKHLMATFEFPVGDSYRRIHVLNVHLRSRAEGEAIRKRQARSLHRWIAPLVRGGEHLILLGDFNSEESGDVPPPDSDLGILCGQETDSPDDDLVDLHLRLPRDQRQTHLLAGKQFDRILCTSSLVDDDPERADLVFRSIAVRSDLAIQGEPDPPQRHWEQYWQIPESERDLSDHFPVIATFEVR
jgi:endonuclease/exonuclease/phosphatase family metal-dependent hydrolase